MAAKSKMTDFEVRIVDMTKVLTTKKGRLCSSIIGVEAKDAETAIPVAQRKLGNYGLTTKQDNLVVIS